MSVQEYLAEPWGGGGLPQGWSIECSSAYTGLLPPPLAQAQQQKIGLKIYWAWPCPSEQDPGSPSVSLFH